MCRNKNFSLEEDEFIRNNFRDLSDDEISTILNRPVGSITRRRQRLKCWQVQQEFTGNLPNEQWKSLSIDGDYYQVSNKGRIKAGNKLSASFINSKGYVQWGIYNNSKNISVSLSLHRAVAEHFCEKPFEWRNDWHVHHIDKNPLNNNSENLVWLSAHDHQAIHKI